MEKYWYINIGKASEIKDKKDRIIYRTFEIIPGALAWTTLISLIFLSFIKPLFIAIFIIIFDLLWITRISYLYLHLGGAFKKMRENMKINWLEKIEKIKDKNWKDIYHLIILPFYKEDISIINSNLDGLLNSNFPVKEKFIVVLSGEERAGDYPKKILEKIKKEYQNKFFQFLTLIHPNLPNELPGKGSNIAWAGKKAKELIDKLKIPYENIIVSAFDIDTIVPKDYFARLTYVWLTTPNNLRASYQPVPLYINNIWQAPMFSRILSFSTTFWNLLNQERPEKLTTFSSHSMSFKALVDVDFWQKNIVSEDAGIFFRCFLRYDGDYRVEPLHYPIFMDANLGPTFRQTMKNVYKQQRRWAWGVEGLPYLLFGILKNKSIPLKKKLSKALFYLEAFWSWSTNSFIIALLGWLPIVAGGTKFKESIMSLNLPFATGIPLRSSLIFLIFSAIFSIMLLPPKPKHFGKTKIVWMFLQWFLMPVIFLSFIALPGIDAQTRLMLGKYMGFWVTPKKRNDLV